MRTRPGLTSYTTARVHNEVDAFKQSFSQSLVSLLITHTNEKGVEKQGENWKPVTDIEMDAFLGLMILAAVFKSNKEALESLWDQTVGRPIFRATMSARRFKDIHAMLRSDNKNQRSGEKGAGIKEFWDSWNYQQALLFIPDDTVTIDEQLIPYRGRVFCRQYMPKKPAKYGLKFFNSCDSRTGYVLHSQMYMGKRYDIKETNQSQRVTEDLMLNRSYEGRTTVTDNWFTSLPLARSLLKNNIGIVGTLRKNRTCIPPALTNIKNRKVMSSVFAHVEDITLVSYIPKKGKNVILLSTNHFDQAVDTTEKKKPLIISFYNKNKGAVDTVDRRIAAYSVKRATRNWKTAVISNGIDISLNNSYVIFEQIFNDRYSTLNGKRLFLQSLGQALVHQQICERERVPRSTFGAAVLRVTRENIQPIAGPSHEVDEQINPTPAKMRRARCAYCIKSDSKFSIICNECNKTICKTHAYILCPKCTDN